MWTTYLRYPKKCMWKKQQNMFAFRKKGFVRPHKNVLGTCMFVLGCMYLDSTHYIMRLVEEDFASLCWPGVLVTNASFRWSSPIR